MGEGRNQLPALLMGWIKRSLLLLVSSAILPGQTAGGNLSAPTGVNASDGSYSTKVGLSWDHLRNAVTYRVFRGAEDDPASAVSIGTTPSLIFFDSTPLPGQTYHYWVLAENANTTSSLSVPDKGFRANGRTSAFDPVPPLAPPRDPVGNPTTGAKIYLGKTLFWEEQLSSTRTVACGTCHRGRSGGSDPRSAVGSSVHPGFDGIFGTDDDITGSPGVPLNRADGAYEWSPMFGLREQVTGRKAQSAINAAYSISSDAGLLWDGKAGHQFTGPPDRGHSDRKGRGAREPGTASHLEYHRDEPQRRHMGRRGDPPRRVATVGALALAAARPRRMDRQPRVS